MIPLHTDDAASAVLRVGCEEIKASTYRDEDAKQIENQIAVETSGRRDHGQERRRDDADRETYHDGRGKTDEPNRQLKPLVSPHLYLPRQLVMPPALASSIMHCKAMVNGVGLTICLQCQVSRYFPPSGQAHFAARLTLRAL